MGGLKLVLFTTLVIGSVAFAGSATAQGRGRGINNGSWPGWNKPRSSFQYRTCH